MPNFIIRTYSKIPFSIYRKTLYSVILQCAPASQGAPMPADLTSADELDYTTQTKSGPWVINTTSKYDHDIVTKPVLKFCSNRNSLSDDMYFLEFKSTL